MSKESQNHRRRKSHKKIKTIYEIKVKTFKEQKYVNPQMKVKRRRWSKIKNRILKKEEKKNEEFKIHNAS